MSEIFNAKIKEKELVDKSDMFDLINNSDLDKKIATLAAKVELKQCVKIVQIQSFSGPY